MGASLSPAILAAIAGGAVIGAWSRWLLGLAFNRLDAPMPWGTLLANVVGGLLVGIAIAVS